jgi:hypothetical protein
MTDRDVDVDDAVDIDVADIDDLGIDLAHHGFSLRARDGPVAPVYALAMGSGIEVVEFERETRSDAAVIFGASLNSRWSVTP